MHPKRVDPEVASWVMTLGANQRELFEKWVVVIKFDADKSRQELEQLAMPLTEDRAKTR